MRLSILIAQIHILYIFVHIHLLNRFHQKHVKYELQIITDSKSRTWAMKSDKLQISKYLIISDFAEQLRQTHGGIKLVDLVWLMHCLKAMWMITEIDWWYSISVRRQMPLDRPKRFNSTSQWLKESLRLCNGNLQQFCQFVPMCKGSSWCKNRWYWNSDITLLWPITCLLL